jgi:hypothetical protein
MAKRVTTTIRQDDFWDNDDLVTHKQKRKKHTGRNFGIIIIIVLLLLTGLIYMKNYKYTGVQQRAQQQIKSAENNKAQTTPAVKQPPVDLSFSGIGKSSTNEFALPAGNYLVSYSFSNAGPNTSSVPEITCANTSVWHVFSGMTGSGSKSTFVSISPSTKCIYNSGTSSGVQWTVKIVNS